MLLITAQAHVKMQYLYVIFAEISYFLLLDVDLQDK